MCNLRDPWLALVIVSCDASHVVIRVAHEYIGLVDIIGFIVTLDCGQYSVVVAFICGKSQQRALTFIDSKLRSRI